MKNICFQMNRKAWLVAIMVLCLSFPALAQKITVSGTVTDKTGEPLIGASVLAKGTQQGTATDFDGNYRIDVDANATLVFSYVGYDTQNVAVNGRTTIDVVLSENSVMLNEVVAIGYGTVKKSDATGAVSAIKPSEVQAGLSTSAQDLLVGRSPGVVVTTAGGQPEGKANIQIRGGASLSASNEPLIVIDGVPMDTKGTLGSSNPLSLVNPESIESMTILKDASATAIFGSRASNGVIIITTKKGSSGAPTVNFAANMYINTPRNYMDMMSASQFRNFIINEYGEGSSQANALGNTSTDWQKEVLRTTVSSDYNLSVGGTYRALPYRVSVSYTNNNGIVETTKMDRATFGLNLSPKFFNGLLSINANLRGAYINNRFYEESALGSAVSFNPTLPVYAPDGNIFLNYTTYAGTAVAGPDTPGSSINTLKALNPVSLLKEYDSQSKVFQSIGNLQIDGALPWLPELHANLNLGYDISRSNVDNIHNAYSPMSWKNGSDLPYVGDVLVAPDQIGSGKYDIKSTRDGQGRTFHEHQVKANLLLDFYLNYKKEFESIRSNLDVTAGYSWQSFRWQGNSLTRINSGAYNNFQAYPTSYYRNDLALVSFFGRLNYGFMDKYLLTVTVRRDGTSRFSKDHRWGTFPSVALAWRLIDENFMASLRPVLSDLKLRVGYGVTGQQDLGDDFFPYLPVYVIGNNGNLEPNTTSYPNPIPESLRGQYGSDYAFINVLKPNGYNTDIKWEETHTWNVGVDFGFLNNRINGSLDFYKRKTKDLLTFTTVPAGSNLTNALNMNIGDLENTGIEFTVSTRPIVTQDLTWSSDFNIAWNQNKITKLTAGNDPDFFIAAGEGISAGTGGTIQAHKVGHPAYSYYVYQQVYDQDGNPIEGQYVDRNGDGQITEADKYLYHSRDPKVVLTWSNSVNYKNWDFGIVLRANIGNWVYNDFEASNVSKSSTASLPLSNLMANRFIFNDLGVKGAMSDYFVRNASFLRCDNITVGYTWPSLINNALRLRLYGAVQNPFVITKYSGLDPEVFSGVDKNIYPRPITVSLGVVASF
ncbi:SusC/RagA family TonB-linked outer membrane protein [Muribaculum intestinale]|uniref:SusC/RagA family TonB-linked outer membrane protein n=1 Tax=Muribaculum intestinale TaxID=1796646 RepID=UPI00242C81A9|nr:TonB-dependent receptor [Muribaculum intestinale]